MRDPYTPQTADDTAHPEGYQQDTQTINKASAANAAVQQESETRSISSNGFLNAKEHPDGSEGAKEIEGGALGE